MSKISQLKCSSCCELLPWSIFPNKKRIKSLEVKVGLCCTGAVSEEASADAAVVTVKAAEETEVKVSRQPRVKVNRGCDWQHTGSRLFYELLPALRNICNLKLFISNCRGDTLL